MNIKPEQIFVQVRKGDMTNFTTQNLSLRDADGNSLLHWAARKGHLDKVDPTLITPANLLQENNKRETPLDFIKDEQQAWALPKEHIAALYPPSLRTLRPYQAEGVTAFKDWYDLPVDETDNQTLEALICLATGMGKTTVAAACIQELLKRGKKVLWVVHTDELIKQAVAEIEALTGEPCEVEKAGKSASGKGNIVVASIQSLHQERLKALAERFTPDLIACDEAHHSPALSYQNVKQIWNRIKVLNLTATRFRNDMFDPLDLGRILVHKSFKDGVELGFLVPPEPVVTCELDLDDVVKRAGDYTTESLGAAMSRESNVLQCLDVLEKHMPGQRTLLYAASVGHARLMADRMALRGLKVGVVDYETKPEDRKVLYDQLRRGEIHGIISYNVLREGFDMPEVTQIVCMRPTTSDVIRVQMWGRGARLDKSNPNKKSFLTIDFTPRPPLRKGKRVVLPTKDELKKAKALTVNEKLTTWELFLSRFQKVDDLVKQVNGGPPPPIIKTPEELYRVFKPTFSPSDPTLAKLQALWPDGDNSKSITKMVTLLRAASPGAFAKTMMDRGFIYVKHGEQPKEMSRIEELQEESAQAFATYESKRTDPVLDWLNSTQGLITDIEEGRQTVEDQIKNCLDPIAYQDGTTVLWTKPIGGSGRFSMLEVKRPDDVNNKYLILRDIKTGKLAGFSTPRRGPLNLTPVSMARFNPKALPTFCTDMRWTKNPASEKQKEWLVPMLARTLKLGEGDLDWKLNPANPNRMMLTAAVANNILTSEWNKKAFKQIEREYEQIQASMTASPVLEAIIPSMA